MYLAKFSIIRIISFSEFIDSALATFVQKLMPEQNGLEEARIQLIQRFSDPNNTNDDSNRYLKSIIEIRPILGCNQNRFYRQEKEKIGEK